MQVIITAVGPDNRGLADPIIHYVTGQGANIAEIQMYDHDELCLFAMLLRIELADGVLSETRSALTEIGRSKGLSVRVWSPEERRARPRLAICASSAICASERHCTVRSSSGTGSRRTPPAIASGSC